MGLPQRWTGLAQPRLAPVRIAPGRASGIRTGPAPTRTGDRIGEPGVGNEGLWIGEPGWTTCERDARARAPIGSTGAAPNDIA